MSNINEQQVIDIDPFNDIDLSAQILAKEVSSLLKKEIDDLNIFSHMFRTALERSVRRILWDSKKNNLPINIYPETIPGFTLFLVRKTIDNDIDENIVIKEDKIGKNPFRAKEDDVVKSVMNNFFGKHEGKVIWIDFNNVIMMLFPVSDTKENLRKMELYIVE